MIHGGFWLVILVQAAWFVATTIAFRNTEKTKTFIIAGLVLGIPYGLAMDTLVGYRTGVFNYQGLEESLGFLVLNALLSYGLAIATMLNLVGFLGSSVSINRRFSYVFFLIGFATLFVHVKFLGDTPLIKMFSMGTVIVCLSEAILILYSGKCMSLSLFRLDFGALKIWFFSIATGFVYEAINIVAGLWVWENDFPSQSVNLLMIVLMGYFVLLFPMLVVAHIFDSLRPRDPT